MTAITASTMLLTQSVFLENVKLIIKAIFCFREIVNVPWKNINAHPVTFNVFIILREVLFVINFESDSKI